MRICILFCLIVLFTSCSKSSMSESTQNGTKILFIVSNQHVYGDTAMNAANHFGEIVFAYDVLINGRL